MEYVMLLVNQIILLYWRNQFKQLIIILNAFLILGMLMLFCLSMIVKQLDDRYVILQNILHLSLLNHVQVVVDPFELLL